MILTGVEREVDSNISESQVFKIKTTSQAFKILSSNLYSNKVRAIVRELSCNAIDSHKMAQNPNPFEVHLPSIFEPYFSVKDFGIGLSDHDVFNLYNSYFESTKSQSNDFIGALGLGSKSPFSYVDSFTVESIFNGEKRIYSTYLNSAGIPTTSFMSCIECSDHNGLEVKIPVKEDDFDRFRREAEIVFYAFELKPIITNCPSYIDLQKSEIENDRVAKTGNGWKLVKTFPGSISDTAYARQGSIMYPLKIDILTENNKDSSSIEFVLRNHIVIDFPLGQLDVAASREEISYDETTKNNILKKINEVYNEIILEINQEANNLSLYDAICYVRQVAGQYRNSRSLQVLHSASNKTITGDEQLFYPAPFNYYFMEKKNSCESLYNYRIAVKKNEETTYSDRGWSFSTIPNKESNVFIEIDEELSDAKFKNKLRYYAGTNNFRSFVYVLTFLPEAKNEFLSAFGNPAYIKLSDITLPVIERKVKAERSVEKNFTDKNTISYNVDLDYFSITESNKKIKYYIPIQNYDFIIKTNETTSLAVSDSVLKEYIQFLTHIKFITKKTSYYCVRKKEMGYKRFTSDTSFEPFDKAAEKYLLAYVNKNEKQISKVASSLKDIESLKSIDIISRIYDYKDERVITNFFNNLEDNALKKAYLRLTDDNVKTQFDNFKTLFANRCIPKSVETKINEIKSASKGDFNIKDIEFMKLFSYSSWRDEVESLKSLAGLVNAVYREIERNASV